MKKQNGQGQHQEEHKYLEESGKPRSLRIEKGHGKEVEHVHFKGQEDQGIDVVIEMKLDPCSGKRTHAAFVGHAHLFVSCSGR